MENIKIAIVGGGSSGLIALYECKMRNIKATLFEKASQIGGVWNLSSGKSWAHKSTLLNSTSFLNSYNLDFNLYDFLKNKYSKEYVDYATSTDFNEYQKAFVEHYDLTNMISVNTEVVDILSREPGKHFTLKAVNVINGEEKLHHFDYVIIASGMHGLPIVPDSNFLESPLKMNEGVIWHTSCWDLLESSSPCPKFIEPKELKILVTGGRYSATEAIQDTITYAKYLGNYKNLKIYWAPTRDPENRNVWSVSRYPFEGKWAKFPFDESVNRISCMFPKLGLLKKVKLGSEPLLINIENEMLNPNRDRYSYIQKDLIKPALQDQTLQILTEPIMRIYQTKSLQVAFDTKSSKETIVDAVVIASGYRHSVPKINGKDVFQDSYRYQHIIPIDRSYSGRIGYLCTIELFGSMISTIQLEVKWLLFQWFHKNSKLEKNLEMLRSKYPNRKSEKPSIEVIGPRLEALAKDMNVKPIIWTKLLSPFCGRRHLALAYIFGPWSIYQYANVDETDAERQRRENSLLISTRDAYKKCGESFKLVCWISDLVYYGSLAAIFSLSYMNCDFMKETITSTWACLLKNYF